MNYSKTFLCIKGNEKITMLEYLTNLKLEERTIQTSGVCSISNKE